MSGIRPRSLLFRLMLATGTGMVVLLSIAGIFLYQTIAANFIREFDRGLLSATNALALMAERAENKIEFEIVLTDGFGPTRGALPEYYQAWFMDQVVLRSKSLGDNELELLNQTKEQPQFNNAALPDGTPIRLAQIQFEPRKEEIDQGNTSTSAAVRKVSTFSSPSEIVLIGAASTESLSKQLTLIGSSIFFCFTIATMLALGLLYFLVQRGLQPLNVLALRIKQIEAANLCARVEVESAPSELVPVVERLNEFLQRLESAFQREKNFTADVAHELRTPLTGLRSTLQVALARPRDAASLRESANDSLAVCNQMIRMVENLLCLARLEHQPPTLLKEPIVLQDLIETCWEQVLGQANERQLSSQIVVETALQVNTDPVHLQQVILNLLDNATCYADANSCVDITAQRVRNGAEIVVRSSGCEFSSEDATKVFDRFWRGDSARTNTQQHSGLGLAVCRSAVERLEGTIQVEIADKNIFSVVVWIPKG